MSESREVGWAAVENEPSWPRRVQAAAQAFRKETIEERKNEHLAALWVDLQLVLLTYARAHARRFSRLDDGELRDIAAEKSLELVRRLDQETGGEFDSLAVGQFCVFLSNVARNGVVDRIRVLAREAAGSEGEAVFDRTAEGTSVTHRGTVGHERSVERLEFALALKDCVSRLTSRSRLVWTLRVFHELASKDIARHPEVGMSVGAIDMTLARARHAVRTCMERKGLALTGNLPAGTFATLWDLFGEDARPGLPGEDLP